MFITPAYAQAASGAASSGSASTLFFFGQMALLMAVFYFLLIRPQQRRAKAARDLIASAKKGDTVVTAGGIMGKITRVEDAQVEVEIAPNVRVRVVKATLVEIVNPKPAND